MIRFQQGDSVNISLLLLTSILSSAVDLENGGRIEGSNGSGVGLFDTVTHDIH